MPSQNPSLTSISLDALRPTQMTVGFAEVALKRQAWHAIAKDKRQTFLTNHCFPAVAGPKDRIYITDHHHLGRALMEEHVTHVWVQMAHDFSGLAKIEFWSVMDHLKLVYPYDAQGRRHDFADIPKSLSELTDDPFRSLSAAVRRAGGYAKEVEPFAEFLWADFFRRRIDAKSLAQPDKALEQALALCHTPAAAHLPGWSGPEATAR